MSIRTLLFFAMVLAFPEVPAFAQCGGGHPSGSGGHDSHKQHSGHQEDAPKKVTATNTICPVKGREVKPGRDRQVIVGGNPYLVCGDGCGPELAEHKEKYLDKDGKPRNAPKDDPKGDPKNDPRKEEPRPAPQPSDHEGHQH